MTAVFQALDGVMLRRIKSAATRSRRRLSGALRRRYSASVNKEVHSKQNRKAESILSTIENQQGAVLDPAIRRLCLEYAGDVLGWEGYSPWLCTYSALAGEFREGWIPDNYYGEVVLPIVNKDMRTISDLRVIESMLFGTRLFPDVLSYANGLFVSPSHEIIPHEAVGGYLFQQADRIVFKLHSSFHGRGVWVYTKENFSVDAVVRAGNGVFQSYVTQHHFFDSFTANSVATIRLTTVADSNGEISCRAAYLRAAMDADPVVLTTKAMRVSIDVPTGLLHTTGYLPNYYAITEHPDSGFVFGGATVPGYFQSVAAVCDLHKKLPFCKCIGWDVCIDTSEMIQIIEWNARHNNIRFSEATAGPSFADLGWEDLWKP